MSFMNNNKLNYLCTFLATATTTERFLLPNENYYFTVLVSVLYVNRIGNSLIIL